MASAVDCFQNVSAPFTRRLNCLIVDSLRLPVTGKPSRQYSGSLMRDW